MDSKPEVGAEEAGQLGRDHPVGAGGAGGVTLRATVLTRPSMLVVVPSTSANPAAAQHHVGLRRRRR